MLDPRSDPIAPPRRLSYNGDARRVGVEIEFAGLTASDAAERIKELFGGTIIEHDPHRFDVEATTLGSFRSELDSRYAHPEGILPTFGDDPAGRGSPEWLAKIGVTVSEVLGHAGAVVIPCEVSTPPLLVAELPAIDRLVHHLRRAGARGTGESAFYAFGLHLNPEIATTDPGWIVSIIRSQMMLSSWLRSIMMIDTSRDLSGFVTPYPRSYVERVTATGYAPDVETLIDGYIADNPSRQRELDLLPLFAWLDSDRTSGLLPRQKITPRPAFHYRLPNAALERADWSVTLEWNRWCLIEKLADDSDLLARLGVEYRRVMASARPDEWVARCSEWLAHGLHHAAVTTPDEA